MFDREWMDQAFSTFDDRARTLIVARAAGRSLAEAGAELGLSRERARQILAELQRRLAVMVDMAIPRWRESVRALGAEPAMRREDFAGALRGEDHILLEPLLLEAGLTAPRTWAGPLRGWWTLHPDGLDTALRQLVAGAPLRGDELDAAAEAAGVPKGIPLPDLLEHPQSKVASSAQGHWVRRKARGRDAAYLYLLQAGRPCVIGEFLTPMSVTTEQAAREALRRDDRFIQIRPEGTWALAEWSHLRPAPYGNAVEALVAVVTEYGPISRGSLFAKVTESYPVSAWRLTQCLLSDQIGETGDGLIDLVSRGARPIEEAEPTKPDTMAVHGDVLGARITVDGDVLRGSGVRVHSWLTWRLGLRQAPMSRTFATAGGHAPLTVRRGTSFAQVSSLRRHARELAVVDGCVLALVLNLREGTAQVLHGCADGSCPARASLSPDREGRTVAKPRARPAGE